MRLGVGVGGSRQQARELVHSLVRPVHEEAEELQTLIYGRLDTLAGAQANLKDSQSEECGHMAASLAFVVDALPAQVQGQLHLVDLPAASLLYKQCKCCRLQALRGSH